MFKLFGKINQKNQQINKEGIGLGLYITKNLVSELGGTITLESKEGSFTKFLITLPVKKELVFDQSHLNWLKGKGVNFKKIRRL